LAFYLRKNEKTRISCPDNWPNLHKDNKLATAYCRWLNYFSVPTEGLHTVNEPKEKENGNATKNEIL